VELRGERVPVVARFGGNTTKDIDLCILVLEKSMNKEEAKDIMDKWETLVNHQAQRIAVSEIEFLTEDKRMMEVVVAKILEAQDVLHQNRMERAIREAWDEGFYYESNKKRKRTALKPEQIILKYISNSDDG